MPLAAALAHLRALDPALSGEVLAPGRLDRHSGLPGFSWLERARAEQVVALATPEADETPDDVLSRAARVEPALATRLRDRRRLHRFLRRNRLLDASHVDTRLKRVTSGCWDLAIAYDRLLPQAGWMRITAEVSAQPRMVQDLFTVSEDGTVDTNDGVQHLLARQCVLPLTVLHAALSDSLEVQVNRLSRTFVGPFWFSGVELPPTAPAWARQGLTLHLSQELMGRDVRESHHRDPWLSPPAQERCPSGFGLFRERRFAASPALVAPVAHWSARRGAPSVVVGLRPR